MSSRSNPLSDLESGGLPAVPSRTQQSTGISFSKVQLIIGTLAVVAVVGTLIGTTAHYAGSSGSSATNANTQSIFNTPMHAGIRRTYKYHGEVGKVAAYTVNRIENMGAATSAYSTPPTGSASNCTLNGGFMYRILDDLSKPLYELHMENLTSCGFQAGQVLQNVEKDGKSLLTTTAHNLMYTVKDLQSGAKAMFAPLQTYQNDLEKAMEPAAEYIASYTGADGKTVGGLVRKVENLFSTSGTSDSWVSTAETMVGDAKAAMDLASKVVSAFKYATSFLNAGASTSFSLGCLAHGIETLASCAEAETGIGAVECGSGIYHTYESC